MKLAQAQNPKMYELLLSIQDRRELLIKYLLQQHLYPLMLLRNLDDDATNPKKVMPQ